MEEASMIPTSRYSSQLEGDAKAIYLAAVKALSVAFSVTQIEVMMEPLFKHEWFNFVDFSEALDLCQELVTFWQARVWSEDMSESFQTMILTRPELDGVKTVFMAHPVVSSLLYVNEEKTPLQRLIGKAQERGQIRKMTESYNDNNDVWASDGFGSDDEELTIRPRVVITTAKTKYQTYEDEVEDTEEIEFVPIERGQNGIIYVFKINMEMGEDFKVGGGFDMIHSVRCDADSMLRFRSGDWMKELYVHAGVWTSVTSSFLPCHHQGFPIEIEIVETRGRQMVEFKIKGVFLSAFEKAKLFKHILSEKFQPYELGFVQDF